MKKKLVVLLSLLLVATNTLYVSAAPAVGVGDSDIVIVDEEESEEVSEEEISEEEISEEEVSEEEISEEEKSEEEASEEDSQEEKSEEADSEEADSEESSEVMDFDDKEIKNIDNTDDKLIDLEATYKNFEYETKDPWSGEKYVIITKYTGYDSAISIPAYIGGVKVTEIGANAFSGNALIESVTFPATVTTIGNKAFYNCSGMKKLTLNNGLTKIGYSAFAKCVSLEKIVIPSSVTTVSGSSYDDGVFEGCVGLTSVTIQNSTIGIRMFKGCSSLTYIKIPATVTYFGYDSFIDCVGLKSASIEANSSIGTYAFSGCTYLENVTLKNITEIGNGAFNNVMIKSIDIPATVTRIGTDSFENCKYLTSVTLHDGLKELGSSAFAGCSSLKTISLPQTLTSISGGAYTLGVFENCTSLTTVSIKGSSIGQRMFQNCTALQSVTVPRSVSNIANDAFNGCTSLKKAVINSTGSIGANAFYNCSQLTTIELQNGLFSSINRGAFAGVPVETIKLPRTVTYIGVDAFLDCKKLKSLTLNTGLLTLDSSAFARCTSLTSVTIPVTVTSVGGGPYTVGVFEDCTSLRDVTIKNTIIGTRMFQGCTALKNIIFPNMVKTINNRAFCGCSSLVAAEFLGDAPASFGNEVFNNCNGAFVIEFFNGKTGWTTPEWNGYRTKAITKLNGDVCAIFEDVKPGDYYVDAVQYLYNKGIMTGKTQTEFGATSQVKREQVVTVLYAAAGKPAVSGTSGFPDVKSTDYFNNAVIWAKKNKITSGLGDGSFGVGNSISRESLAMMLYGYAKFKGIKTKKTAGASNGFSDSSQISSYAKDAMDWAVTQGIISGKGTGSNAQKRLDPKGKAARSEFAVMMAKLLK